MTISLYIRYTLCDHDNIILEVNKLSDTSITRLVSHDINYYFNLYVVKKHFYIYIEKTKLCSSGR